jgi:hypothetical protein
MNEPRLIIPVYGWRNSPSSRCADLIVVVGRDLGTLMGAITELSGPEQARPSAEDRINELESMDASPGVTERDWAAVIIVASAQLAKRLHTDADRPMSRVASTDTKVSPIPSSNCLGPTVLA